MKKVIFTNEAPKPIGPYSQAILSNGILYVSGQIAIDPKSGELCNSTIQEETHRVLDNLGAILKAASMDYTHVLKCSVFVKDINQFNIINAIYNTYFQGTEPPARELVQVAELPRFVNIEISCIAAE
ncbi:MAG: RidA family protein [Saprospiraceae bacterium]|nr:RidA family protein [Saprospiraceae bacterium]